MTVKEWYRVLLEKNVTKHEIDEEGRMGLIPCKAEERNPQFMWSDTRSFLFKLVHKLLPGQGKGPPPYSYIIPTMLV